MKNAYMDTKQVKQMFNNLENVPANEGSDFIFTLGILINTSIRTRTQDSGMGTFKKLPKYSDKYARFREKKGRDTAIRNLTFSGRMFNAQVAEPLGKDKVILSFGTDEEKDKALGNDERTPFFGIGPTEDDVINSESKKFLEGLKV